MAIKHTPGPWAVDVGWANRRLRGKKRGPMTMLMVVAEKGGMPGIIVNVPPIVEERDVANAALIAAAPDLLAALEAMVSTFDPNRQAIYSFANAQIKAARAAIKKAKGEA